MIKALSEPKSETKPKPEAKPKQTSKTKPESKPKPKPEPKLERRINKRKLGEFRKDFDELRHKFSRREIQEYRNTFYNIKKYKHFSISEIKEAKIKKKSWRIKKAPEI